MVEERPFGALLRDLRLATGLSQEALAERAALSPQAVGALEGGRRSVPRRETVDALAHALGLDVGQAVALAAAVRRGRGAARGPPRRSSCRRPPRRCSGARMSLRELTAQLGQPERACWRLIGPGGVGKTRLALQVAIGAAATFPDGAAWVDLSPVRDPELVAATIAARLGVRATGLTPLAELLVAHLAERRLLLVLDNLEQVLPARDLVQGLLDACPGLRVLATSRVPLGLQGERVYALAPLPVPPPDQEDPEAIAAHASVALFMERAREVAPRLAVTAAAAVAIAAICRRLDGLPLAIELAAALVKLLPPQAMLARLIASTPARGGALDLLAGGAWDRPDRQQTMRDTIAWSHDLLRPAEQAAIPPARGVRGRLHPGGGGDGVRRSRGRAGRAGGHGGAAGQEPARAAGGEADAARRHAGDNPGLCGGTAGAERESARMRERHAAYFLALALEAEPELEGPQQAAWLQRLEAELDNIRAALLRSAEGEDTATGLQLASALLNFWTIRGHFAEGRSWVERLLGRAGAAAVTTPFAPARCTSRGGWPICRATICRR